MIKISKSLRVLSACTIFFVGISSYAVAQGWDHLSEMPSHKRMALLPGDDRCFAYVEIDNIAGVYNADETLSTEHGDVVINYTTVGGHNPTDHDRASVVSLPSEVVAVPFDLEIPDGDKGSICLMHYVGG
jgi:hypothetical protein